VLQGVIPDEVIELNKIKSISRT